MKWKSAKQRKAVMARLQNKRWKNMVKIPEGKVVKAKQTLRNNPSKSDLILTKAEWKKSINIPRGSVQWNNEGTNFYSKLYVWKSPNTKKWNVEKDIFKVGGDAQRAENIGSFKTKKEAVAMAKRHMKDKNHKHYNIAWKDKDKDGVVDAYDCDPNDPKKQGLLHDAIAGVGKVGGYVGGEVVSGVKDIRGRAKTQFELTKERERLEQEKRAVATERQIQAMQQQYRQLKGQEVGIRQQRRSLDKTPITVKRSYVKTSKSNKRSSSDGWDDGSGSVWD